MAFESNSFHRVAIYAAPDPRSVWWRVGSEWLGRCASQAVAVTQPIISGIDPAELLRLTADPRRYGWHATLKAPFRLGAGIGFPALREVLAAIAQDHPAFDIGHFKVTHLGKFFALQPVDPPAALTALANDCVQRLQPLAAPLNEYELTRRRKGRLTPQEDALMLAWGYPWVLDRFNFHFSLTGPLTGLTEENLKRLHQSAADHFRNLPPLRMDRLSVFIEPSPGADFDMFEQVELAP
jgi:hypothetical protein